jgi:amidohydrolase
MDAKTAARETVGTNAQTLVGLSHRVHAHPELRFEETKSSQWTAGLLADAGLTVESGICDLPTAFSCSFGSGSLHLAICAEYDALPGIGHACGHNIIAATAVGAGLALAPLVDDLDLRVSVIGTPAEEGGGGKVFLLERGAFAGVDAAMMVHPAPYEDLEPRISAVAHFGVSYEGRPSHASAAPELGINAADAFTVAQVAIGLLRQHLRRDEQVHGFISHGGDAPNIVPAHTEGVWMVRAPTVEDVASARPRVERCFEAGALATGAQLTIADVAPVYSQMEHDAGILDVYRQNAVALGRAVDDEHEVTFSTDMGNVSLDIPSIHPCIAIESDGAVNHQPEFAGACINASADRAVLEGALAMAWTAIDLASGPLRDRLQR